MAGYKKDQGRMVRMAVFWASAILLFYGCTALRRELSGLWPQKLGQPLIASMPKLPVVGVALTGALLIAVVLFVGALILAQRWLERPKNADLLIETETELRKVTWPTAQEVFSSSAVVVVCVLLMMAFLAGADWVLAHLINPIIFG